MVDTIHHMYVYPTCTEMHGEELQDHVDEKDHVNA